MSGFTVLQPKLSIGETASHDGVTYQLVRWPTDPSASNSCEGCALNVENSACKVLLRLTPENKFHYCVGTVYIHDTPEARTKHALRLLDLL